MNGTQILRASRTGNRHRRGRAVVRLAPGEPSTVQSNSHSIPPVLDFYWHETGVRLYTGWGRTNDGMTTGLSEEDMDRIEQFVQTPAYKRRPELLLPEDAETAERP